jgi:hypothetical protein
MKKVLFFSLLFLLLLNSCFNKNDKNATKSTGQINNITLIIDEQLWNGVVGDSIRNKFAAPVIGLPEEEPLFNINQYSSKFLGDYLANSRNIIVIRRDKNNVINIFENKYVTPQNIFQITGTSTNTILKIIEKKTPDIINKIHQTEIVENQKIIDTALIDSKKIEQKFKIKINIPKNYNYVFEKRKLLWLKKEISSGNTSILIYEIPYYSLENKNYPIKSIVKMRDSIGSLYIHGTASNTRMITEKSYSPYLYNVEIDGIKSFETKGTWQMKNDYMSGPFLNYCVLDKKNNRILVLEGFCYAPSKEKRDLMFELEAIIKSVKFNNKE